jgi:hypothetical protein
MSVSWTLGSSVEEEDRRKCAGSEGSEGRMGLPVTGCRAMMALGGKRDVVVVVVLALVAWGEKGFGRSEL